MNRCRRVVGAAPGDRVRASGSRAITRRIVARWRRSAGPEAALALPRARDKHRRRRLCARRSRGDDPRDHMARLPLRGRSRCARAGRERRHEGTRGAIRLRSPRVAGASVPPQEYGAVRASIAALLAGARGSAARATTPPWPGGPGHRRTSTRSSASQRGGRVGREPAAECDTRAGRRGEAEGAVRVESRAQQPAVRRRRRGRAPAITGGGAQPAPRPGEGRGASPSLPLSGAREGACLPRRGEEMARVQASQLLSDGGTRWRCSGRRGARVDT